MDDAKRRALIRSQATKKKESGDMAPTATVASNPSIKRKSLPKGDHSTKKPRVSLEPVVGREDGHPCKTWGRQRPYEGSVHHSRQTTYPPS